MENGNKGEGRLEDCRNDGKGRLVCAWREKTGARGQRGLLDIRFSGDLQNFEGTRVLKKPFIGAWHLLERNNIGTRM